jgi:4-amino-4-deoxy-L-arabinose transferase-like glycosyltransferase
MARWSDSLKRTSLRVLRHPRFWPACLAVALLLRLAVIAIFDARPENDFNWYYEKGLDIAAGKGYVVTDDGFPLWRPGKPLAAPRPTAFWPVGYPAFLGVLFAATSWLVQPLVAAKIANAILYVVSIAAIAYSARVIFASDLAGRATALILALLPNHIAYTTLTSVEIYFVFLTSCAIALLLRYQEHERRIFLFLAGILLGLAVLTKPQALLLPAALALVFSWGRWRELVQRVVVLYAVVVLVVSPWTIRNYKAFDGHFIPVSNNGGINLLISNMPGSWGRDGYMWNKELHQIVTTIDDEFARDKAAREAFSNYLSENAGSFLLGFPKKIWVLYAVDVDGFGWNQSAVARYRHASFWLPLRMGSQLYYMSVFASAAVCVWLKRRDRGAYFMVGPAVFLYFTGICLAFSGAPRFHFPVVPWLAAYAGGLLAILLDEPARSPAKSSGDQ